MERERLTKREVIKEVNHPDEALTDKPLSVRQLQNNTFEIQYRNGNKAIRYHHTDIITYHPNGDIVLNTDGYLTRTTKERMGYLRGYRITQENKIWYLSWYLSPKGIEKYVYKDEMIIHADGTVTGNGTDPKKLLSLDKQIKKYIDGYIKALFDGKINKPSNGDCWGCLMKDVTTGKTVFGSDHILSHFEEKYYVPSLLMNAIELFPVSIATKSSIGYYLKFHDQECKTFDDIARRQVKSSLRRYLRRQLGMAA